VSRLTQPQHEATAAQLQQACKAIEEAEDQLRTARRALIAANKPQQAFKAKTLLSGLNNLAGNAAASYRYHNERKEEPA